ncbi:vWA domain-containing protein [Singulisphaera rosea]
MWTRRRFALGFALALMLVATYTTTRGVFAAGPLAESDLGKLLSLQIDDDAIVAKIRKDGLSFLADENALRRIKDLGASDVVLEAVRLASRASSTSPPLTYDDVLGLLKLGLSSPEIVKRLEKSPTVFTLDAGQVDALKQAGAGDYLIVAMSSSRKGAEASSEVTDIAVILDCSASMSEATKEGPSKMRAAQRVVTDLVQKIPDGIGLSFLIYGHDRKQRCEAIAVIRPLSPLDSTGKGELTSIIGRLQPVGSTPIALALRTAGNELAKAQGPRGLVLITDGKETCNGDPVAEAEALARSGNLTFGVNVVGFGVNDNERVSLELVARAGRGKYFDARGAAELQQALRNIRKKVDAPIVVTTNQGDELRFGSRASWADKVVSVQPGNDVPASSNDPQEALGAPNYDSVADNRYLALGTGGQVTLEFVDNRLIDIAGPDLAIFEIGPAIETTEVAISEDGRSWINIGQAAGGKATLDIGPFVKEGQQFRFVRLKDSGTNNSPDGADIDAVGALGSVRVDVD